MQYTTTLQNFKAMPEPSDEDVAKFYNDKGYHMSLTGHLYNVPKSK